MSGAGFWDKLASRQTAEAAARREAADREWAERACTGTCLACGHRGSDVMWGRCWQCDGWPEEEAAVSSDHRPELQAHKPPHMKRNGRDGACPQPGVSRL